MPQRRPVYLDHNSTTPLDPRVAAVMEEVAREYPGNPESAHGAGRRARARLEEARAALAAAIGAASEDVIFTSGGTESDNLAVFGAARALSPRGRHLVTSEIEHPAVREAFGVLESGGFVVSRLPVNRLGLVDPAALPGALRPDTIFASVMLANNETGAIQPVREIAATCREAGVTFHTDAVQALGKVPVDVGELGVDLLSAAAHKLYGPRGIGLLYRRPGIRLAPVLVGGRQEGGLRPGTVPVALAAGFARAIQIALEDLEDEGRRLRGLTEDLFARLAERIPGLGRNGPSRRRLPNTLNVTVPGAGGEAILIALDREGFQVATGSACATGAALPSHVLRAMGYTPAEVSSSIRLSLGRSTTETGLHDLAHALGEISARLRKVSGGDFP